MALLSMNQPDGFDCPGCAWPDPKHTSSLEFHENGAKAATDRNVWCGFKALPYAIPQGSIGAYYPETNPLLPLSFHDVKGKTPRRNRFQCWCG